MLTPGTIVGGKYRLESEIGQGGMATVWRAVHTTLDRPVAVKFLEAVGAGSAQLAARFLNEAKLAAGLRHRHVVDILDFGVVDEADGRPFMVMELLEGQSLADRYNDGPPVSDWELLEIIAMILSGLAAVHGAGILHRDVKPENIFLVRDEDGIFPKLLDFGISRGFTAERITRTGSVVGTPQYMSPEQARGKKDLDPRSDLWSVGVVLYEGFAGEVPWDSDSPGDVLIAVATEPHKPLDQLRPDLPPSVIELVHRALRKPREERFQNAREMRESVLAILQGAEEMTGRPPTAMIRHNYSTQGTGRLRVLSVPPGIDGNGSLEQPLVVASLQSSEATATAPRPTPTATAAAPIEPARRARGSVTFTVLGVIALAAIAAGAFVMFDGRQTLERAGLLEEEVGAGGAGEVRPGDAVQVSTPPPDDPLPGPPDDGIERPPAQTIDVPSPPDPPALAPEEGADAQTADGGATLDAGTTHGPSKRSRRRARRGR